MSQILTSRARTRLADTPTGPLAVLDIDPSTAARPDSTEPGDRRRPTVLLVPGYTGSKEDFLPLLDPLADVGWRVVAVDQRGQYESPCTGDATCYTVQALGRDLLALVAGLGGEPVHVLGHSFGGLVARAAVIEAPERFASLVLLDSGPAALGGARQERMRALRPLLARGGMPAVYAAMESLAAGDPKWSNGPQELRDFLKQRFLASSPLALEGMGDALLTEPDRVSELRRTGVPVLVAYGEADNAWTPAAQAEMAVRLGARHEVIADAVHSPAIENTPATLRVLAEFWAATEAADSETTVR